MGEKSERRDSSGDRTRLLKIYGERNSGTNYLQALLTRNLRVRCLAGGAPKVLQRIAPTSERTRDWVSWATRSRTLGWKHALPPTPDQLAARRLDVRKVVFVTITKNPYSWLVSLYRRPYHARRSYSSFTQFLSEPWETVGRENAPGAFTSPVDMWNKKNAAYLALADYATSVNCRYEDLLAAPLAFVGELSDDFRIEKRIHPFENVDPATKGADRGKTYRDYRAYYLEERWRDELDSTSLQLINDRLDFDLMSHHGYSRIEGPPPFVHAPEPRHRPPK